MAFSSRPKCHGYTTICHSFNRLAPAKINCSNVLICAAGGETVVSACYQSAWCFQSDKIRLPIAWHTVAWPLTTIDIYLRVQYIICVFTHFWESNNFFILKVITSLPTASSHRINCSSDHQGGGPGSLYYSPVTSAITSHTPLTSLPI